MSRTGQEIWITASDAADRLGVSTRQVRRLCEKMTIKSYRDLYGRWRVALSAVVERLDNPPRRGPVPANEGSE